MPDPWGFQMFVWGLVWWLLGRQCRQPFSLQCAIFIDFAGANETFPWSFSLACATEWRVKHSENTVSRVKQANALHFSFKVEFRQSLNAGTKSSVT